MTSWTRHCLREDVRTAADIDHGLAIQCIAGPSAAYLYLTQRRIPLQIIKRVMCAPNERRQPGLVALAPIRR